MYWKELYLWLTVFAVYGAWRSMPSNGRCYEVISIFGKVIPIRFCYDYALSMNLKTYWYFNLSGDRTQYDSLNYLRNLRRDQVGRSFNGILYLMRGWDAVHVFILSWRKSGLLVYTRREDSE